MANRLKFTKKEVAQKLGVSVSSLYYKAKRESIDLELKNQIEAVMDSNPDYGHKRIALVLKMNKKKILRVKKKDINKPKAQYQNLIKDIAVIDRPNLVWASDFTYLKWQGRFLYLSTIIDIYGRNIVGFNLANRHTKELVLGALENALTSNPKPQYLHSDQGSEYDSQVYAVFCETIGIRISMSNKASPWENSYQESFYSHFKIQLADINRFYDIADLIEEISKLSGTTIMKESIQFLNAHRKCI